MRGRIGIAHLSNFCLRVAKSFCSHPLPPPVIFSKIRSVVRPSVDRTSVRPSTSQFSEPEFRRISSPSATTYLYAYTYGVSTKNCSSLFAAFCARKVKIILEVSNSIIRIRYSTSSKSMMRCSNRSAFLHTTSLFNPLASCEGRNAQTNLEAASSTS